MKNEEIRDLLNDSIIRLEQSSISDSGIIEEMNNTLNWLLTLTVLLFVFYSKYYDENLSEFETIVIQSSRAIFSVSVVLLIIHKLALIRYLKIRTLYLDSLRTHQLELKYDLSSLRRKYNFSKKIIIPDFINKFRDGVFVPNPKIDNRAIIFRRFDKIISRNGIIMKITYGFEIALFTIYFLGVVSLL